MWFLTRTSDCRIFQQKSVPDIIEQIFGDLGFSDYKLQLSGSHPAREYTVQYRETDFNFVSRLAEEEGIFWFFQHEDGKHTLVMADNKVAYVDCVENRVDYPRDFGSRAIQDHITSWEHRYEFRTGKFAQTDYNFETPSTSLMTNSNTVVPIPGADKYEFYDYPGTYVNKGDGSGLTDMRMEEEEVEHDVVEATSFCKSFTPGGKFTIKSHRSGSEEGKTFVITSIQHSAVEPLVYETGTPEGLDYRNSFSCIPDSVVFRPARITPKPFVQGAQTAVVVGPGGEEIFTDEFGRVKVQFHWDREGEKNEKSSCWVRVSQSSAGEKWGAHFWPRIGHEVVVTFLEGDPDRPLITGCVYNAENKPPYDLPANQTQSGIKTRSSKGGDANNFNEIRFEDKKGAEQLLVHAERNYDLEVENDETHWVGNDRTKTIECNETTHIKANQDETVDGDRTVYVVGAFTETIDSGETRKVAAGVTETIIGGETRDITGDQEETVTGAVKQTISGVYEQKVTGGLKITTPAMFEVTATAGAKLIVPGGYTVVAPGGQTQVDNYWDAKGVQHKTLYSERQSVTTGLLQSVFNIRSATRHINFRFTTLKVDYVAMLASDTGTKLLKASGVKLQMNGVAIEIPGAKIIS